ncbi:MAG: hypothetical protein WBZ36_18365 [Candidatus Nitrosopolaris sp.]
MSITYLIYVIVGVIVLIVLQAQKREWSSKMIYMLDVHVDVRFACGTAKKLHDAIGKGLLVGWVTACLV